MYYYLYEIKNNINNKIYIGVHKTKNIDDNYMGSGKLIIYAIKKYGISNFTKTILETFTSQEQMFLKEKEIVNEEFLKGHVYNMAIGGSGGSIDLNRKPFTQQHSEKTKKKIATSSIGRIHSAETKKKMRANSFARTNPTQQKINATNAAKESWTENNASHKEAISKSLKLTNAKNKELGISHPVIGIKREKIQCMHCKKLGAANVMIRWHFENCKSKESY